LREKAVLACLHVPGGWSLADDVAELAELARTADAEVVATVLQTRGRPDPATLFSSGKVEEIRQALEAHGARTVLCNRDLSPAHQRNLEVALHAKVVDRTRLILDIFARRAQSREGRVQVELAQCLYLLPRLSSLVEEMGRTGGGIGTRGPGETQLESDRRRVRARIAALRHQLQDLGTTRAVQRRGRPPDLARVALVGYTNAGKSTLHRALTGSNAYVEDALFATLDPTTRLLALPGNRRALLTDTVGFVHDLPPHLVAAFRATLEEVASADLLLEVVDASHPHWWDERLAVEAALEALGAQEIPRILVWNKVDLLGAGAPADRPRLGRPSPGTPPGGPRPAPRTDLPTVSVSALHGTGLDALRDLVAACLPDRRVEVRARLDHRAASLVAALRREGEILELVYTADGIEVRARCGPALAARVRAAARAAEPAVR
jgi:GTP-binding protein HflX